MKYYVRSDYMCSTKVAFNMKTVENIFFFLEFFRLNYFWSLFSLFFMLRNYTLNTHKHRLRGSDGTEAWLMRKSHTRDVCYVIGYGILIWLKTQYYFRIYELFYRNMCRMI